MPPRKNCFLHAERPRDLTCKEAFEVDDPADNLDGYLIWSAHDFGEGLLEMRRALEGAAGGLSLGGGSGAPGTKPPKGFSSH